MLKLPIGCDTVDRQYVAHPRANPMVSKTWPSTPHFNVDGDDVPVRFALPPETIPTNQQIEILGRGGDLNNVCFGSAIYFRLRYRRRSPVNVGSVRLRPSSASAGAPAVAHDEREAKQAAFGPIDIDYDLLIYGNQNLKTRVDCVPNSGRSCTRGRHPQLRLEK